MEKKSLVVSSQKLDTKIRAMKNELPKKIQEFKDNYMEYMVDKVGNTLNVTNPLKVSMVFFESITPVLNSETVYNSNQLSSVYDLYKYIVKQVNLEIMPYQPTLSNFAKFAGLTVEQLQEWRNSSNFGLHIVATRIFDESYDTNISLAQSGVLKSTPTLFRMKTENAVVEKQTPKVNVNVNVDNIDLDKINARLDYIKQYNEKSIKYEE